MPKSDSPTDPPIVPRRILFGNPERTSPRISPDSSLLAYLAPDEGVLNVWVRTIGLDDDRPITTDRKRGIRSFFWQSDSRQILYSQDRDGDENFHLYRTTLDTRSTTDLTPFDGARAMPVAVDRNFPDEILVGVNERDRRVFDVYRLRLGTGELVPDTENPGDVAAWDADNRLQIRTATVQSPNGGTIIRIRDDSTAPWKDLISWGPDESGGGIAGFTPDDQSLLLISSIDSDAARVLEIGLDGTVRTVLAEDPEYDVADIMRNPRDHHLEAVRVVRARAEWIVIDPDLEPDFAALRELSSGDFNIVSRDFDDLRWVIACPRDIGSTAYYLYTRADKSAEMLFYAQPELDAYTLSPMTPVSFTARDGMRLHGYLTLPAGAPSGKIPLVLSVHGGPWSRDTWGYSPTVQLFANRGYAVLQINFRGSTGYGKAYLNAGDREWGGKMHEDLLDGKAWAIEQGFADPDRVAIFGGSYGGYAALAGLAFTPGEFACAVDYVGPSSLMTLLRTIPPYWEPMKARFFKRVGHPDTDQEFLDSRSPLFAADRIDAPLLIAQGANDPRVKKAESDQIVEAMRTNGKPVEYLVFPDEGHGFARPENRMKFYAAVEQFLAEHLGGRAEAVSSQESFEDLRQ